MIRALKLIGIFILSFVVIFTIIIWASPKTINYTNEVIINAPKTQVWNTYLDTNQMDKWFVNLDSIYTSAGKPFSEGHEQIITMNNGERKSSMVQITTKMETESLFEFKREVKNAMSVSNSVVFEAIDSNTTKINHNSNIKAQHWLIRLYLFNADERNKIAQDSSYHLLKTFIEK